MVNKTNKGNRVELEARKMLQEEGYLVEKKNYSRWHGNDFWNLFDIFALPTSKVAGKPIRLIQIKSNRTDFYKARKEISQWMLDNGINKVSCEVWLKEPRKAWRQEKTKPQDSTGETFDKVVDTKDV